MRDRTMHEKNNEEKKKHNNTTQKFSQRNESKDYYYSLIRSFIHHVVQSLSFQASPAGRHRRGEVLPRRAVRARRILRIPGAHHRR